jgi:hypothetical protein
MGGEETLTESACLSFRTLFPMRSEGWVKAKLATRTTATQEDPNAIP